MHYVQPDLPYDEAALEPAISAKTVHFHYGVHEKAYIDNLNKLIEGTPFADEDLEEIIRTADGAILNNAAQAWNHILYFFSLNPDGGGEPDGELRKA
ncbi:MAG: superoxide dismutase, partial [Muribaculaceae bacterium]|nr:superoxide dismutase [Muribaculaceae bacterium]